jgi:hypothetical protein
MDVFTLMFGLNSSNAVRKGADEVVDVVSETEMDAFDTLPVLNIEALVIE